MQDKGFAADELPYLRAKWRGDVTDPSTGIGLNALKAEAGRIVADEKDTEPWCIVKAHLFETICDRMSVGFSPHDFFPAFACWSRRDRILTKTINARVAEVDRRYCPDAAKRAESVKGSCLRHDYDHAVPDWDRMLALGFPGMKAAIDASPADPRLPLATAIGTDFLIVHRKRRRKRHPRQCRVAVAADGIDCDASAPAPDHLTTRQEPADFRDSTAPMSTRTPKIRGWPARSVAPAIQAAFRPLLRHGELDGSVNTPPTSV